MPCGLRTNLGLHGIFLDSAKVGNIIFYFENTFSEGENSFCEVQLFTRPLCDPHSDFSDKAKMILGHVLSFAADLAVVAMGYVVMEISTTNKFWDRGN